MRYVALTSHKFSLFLVEVIQAEIEVATLLENNIPLAFTDKLNKVFPIVFPDSNIAKEYRMAKTKTTYILNKSFALYFLQETVGVMKNEYYSLSTDESFNSDLEKMNPLSVRLFDVNTKKVETRFLNLCCTLFNPQGLQKQYFLKLCPLKITSKYLGKTVLAFHWIM